MELSEMRRRIMVEGIREAVEACEAQWNMNESRIWGCKSSDLKAYADNLEGKNDAKKQ